jgi:hypothetical protein
MLRLHNQFCRKTQLSLQENSLQFFLDSKASGKRKILRCFKFNYREGGCRGVEMGEVNQLLVSDSKLQKTFSHS